MSVPSVTVTTQTASVVVSGEPAAVVVPAETVVRVVSVAMQGPAGPSGAVGEEVGVAWSWAGYVESLGTGQSKDVRLSVQALGLSPHLKLEVVSSGDAEVRFYEAPTFGAAGTQRTPVASDRNSLASPHVDIYEDPTISDTGTLIWQGLLLAASPSGGTFEFTLKLATEYAVRVTSRGGLNKVLIRAVWREEI